MNKRILFFSIILVILTCTIASVDDSSAANQGTQIVSVATNGTQGNGDSSEPSISTDGRYVAFASNADNLVLGDNNQHGDVFASGSGVNGIFNTRTGLFYNTIQLALDDPLTLNWDTIQVNDQDLIENVVINKSINLIGDNSTVTAANPYLPVFLVTTDGEGSVIQGFTITGATNSFGVYLDSVSNCQIVDNTISGNFIGVYIQNSDSNTVLGNTVQNNGWLGVCVDNSSITTIYGNIIRGNVEGVYIVNTANGNFVTDNDIQYNVDAGVNILNNSTMNSVNENTAISNNGVVGVLIRDSDNNGIVLNNIQDNGWTGVALDNADRNSITDSNISGNLEGLNITNSSDNGISGNNIIGNTNIGISIINSSTGNFITSNTAISYNGVIGIYLRDSGTNTLNGNTIQINSWVGVCLDNAAGNDLHGNNNISGNLEGLYMVNNSNNNSITTNNIHENADTGIYIDGSTGNNITSNIAISGNGVIGILLRVASNNNIVDNTIADNDWAGVALDNAAKNTIVVNSITGSQEGIYLTSSGINIIDSNTVSSNTGNGISILDSDFNTLTGNQVMMNGSMGLFIRNSDYNTINNLNSIYNNGWGGIVLDQATNTSISACNVFDNPFAGIAVFGGNNNYIIKNSATRNSLHNNGFGVYIDNSYGNVVSQSDITDNDSCGVYLYTTNGNLIERNEINYNDYAGVAIFESSQDNIIRENNIQLNNYGCYISDSSLNYIYLNNFISNTQQVYVESGSNLFYGSEYAGGNYWSDYTGWDNDQDGYGDTPYSFTGGNDPMPYTGYLLHVYPGEYSIQTTINLAQPGDAVIVHGLNGTPWTYQENLTIDQRLLLKTIDGELNVTVQAYDPTYPCFWITNTGSGTIIQRFIITDASNPYPPAGSKPYGIILDHVNNCVVEGNYLTRNTYGIYLEESSYNTIKNNTLVGGTGCGFGGIGVYKGENNIITQNDISRFNEVGLGKSEFGLLIKESPNNIITYNSVQDSDYGIRVITSIVGGLPHLGENNVLRGNVVRNNLYNFGAEGMQDIDTSNFVNDKPVYYIIGANGLTFDYSMNIGYLGLVNCSNITVAGLIIDHNWYGLLMENTTDSQIINCQFIHNFTSIRLITSSYNEINSNVVEDNLNCGIEVLDMSNGNTINNNTIDQNPYGINMIYSDANYIHSNSIDNNFHGVDVLNGNDNVIRYNNILSNEVGMILDGVQQTPNYITENQIAYNELGIITNPTLVHSYIYQNNFIENIQQASGGWGIWSNGGYGNYWSDWTSPDVNGDGIVDLPYIIGSYQDDYPLVSPVGSG